MQTIIILPCKIRCQMVIAMIFCFSHANLCFPIVILESDGASFPIVYFILK